MSLACYTNFIGIRSRPIPVTPKSGLYIEDLPGVDLKRIAMVAADSTGVALIDKCVVNACEETTDEALNYKLNERSKPVMATNQVGAMYAQARFKDNVLPLYAGQRGTTFELQRPDLYQLSKLVVKRIYIRSEADQTGVVVKIVDGNTTTDLDAVDLTAKEVKTIDADVEVNQTTFQITTDHTAIQFYQAYTPLDYGCVSCGGARLSPDYQNGIATLKVSGGYGITADVAIECDLDKVKCNILHWLRQAVKFKAGMLLAMEAQFSDRLNFYASSMDFQSFYNYCQTEYTAHLQRAVPSLRTILRPMDANCFNLSQVSRSQIIV